MNNQTFHRCARAKHQGFSLLEVLVAVVVLSIGLLGLAALQLKGLQAAHSGYQRSLASVIANDAVERLWVSIPSGLPTGTTLTTIQTDWLAAWQPSAVANANIRPTLPGLAASEITDEGDGTYLITVEWSEERFTNDLAGASTFEYRITLPDL